MALRRITGRIGLLGLPRDATPAIKSTVAALRETRLAVTEVEGDLGAVLDCLHSPDVKVIRTAADRLHQSTTEASVAMANLSTNHDLFA